MTKRLIMFYGAECPHCHKMMPLVAKLEKETTLAVTQLETWHAPKNAALQKTYDKGSCGGVPFFYNEKTGKKICGEVPYDKLKAWAIASKG